MKRYIADIRADEGIRIRKDNICPCLHSVSGGLLTNVPVLIEMANSMSSNYETATDIGRLILEDKIVRVRRLMPIECFRLQGFSDEYFKRAKLVNSDSQLYKQAGNSVTVNVIHEIAKRLTEI